jgi:hypothetical protein
MAVSLDARQLPADAAGIAALVRNHREHRRTVAIAAHSIDLTISARANAPDAAIEALASATTTALARLDAWLGPLPAPALTVIDVPWHLGIAGASYPGVVVTSTRWLSTSRDPAFERPLLAALARQYTFSVAAPGDAHAAFEEGLALYLGRRLLHEQLHSRNFETPRFFGGFVPFSVRSVLNSAKPEDPRLQLQRLADVELPADGPWRAASAAPGEPAQRIAALLYTFERHVGWPAFQQVLHQFVDRFRGRPATPEDFSAVASELIGHDLSAFFAPALLAATPFDYALVDLRNDPREGGFTTTVVVGRTGVEPPIAGIPLVVRFDDGAEVTERLNSREVEQAFVYRAPAPAVLASVDPDAVLVFDANRENNTRVLQPRINRIGVRIALNWMVWLQDAVLAYTALL